MNLMLPNNAGVLIWGGVAAGLTVDQHKTPRPPHCPRHNYLLIGEFCSACDLEGRAMKRTMGDAGAS